MGRFLLLLALFSMTIVMISSFKIWKARDAADDRVEVYCATAGCDLCQSNVETSGLQNQLQSHNITLTLHPLDHTDVSQVEQNNDIQLLTDCSESIARCYQDGTLGDDFAVMDMSSLKDALRQFYRITLT